MIAGKAKVLALMSNNRGVAFSKSHSQQFSTVKIPLQNFASPNGWHITFFWNFKGSCRDRCSKIQEPNI